MIARTIPADETELLQLTNQLLDEIEDLRVAIEYDEELMNTSSIFIEPLSRELSTVVT